ncbi:hypothetical protein SMACR_01183 [Sordaria macrospora]|uniref:Uncharacterized protein n=1 Tax=Sordaria macrospora TaxID=5147 RepID=A0A8S8ZW11_SORMA|nr:hypothetical protein SMACR_01183 [Sordaria macrospora]WPJ62419.1 hypothetical protein SMAC4_01183 [Sordaria macrospora]
MPAQPKLNPLRRAPSTRFEFRDDDSDSDSDDFDQPPSASGHHPVTGLGISLKGPTPPPDTGASGYETVPVQPPPRNPRRLTVQHKQTFRPTSSVYSENSPPLAPHDPEQPSTLASHHFQRYGGGEEISPPSSPEPSYSQPRRPPVLPPGDVSPIEEEYEETAQGAFEPQPYGRNQHAQQHLYYPGPGPRPAPPNHDAAPSINMMRRGQRKLSDAALRDTHANRALPSQQARNPGPGFPMFDPVTGERLDSAHGRPLNRPLPGAPYGPGQGFARQQSPPPLAGPQPRMASVGDRMMRMASPEPRNSRPDPAAGAFTANRPGWRGPSGRTAIVDPVRDNPAVPPLRIPDRNGRRVVSQQAPGPGQRPELSLGIPRRDEIPPPPRAGAQMGYAPRDPGQRVMSSSQIHPQSATTPRPVRSPVYPNPPHSAITPRGDAPFVAAQQLQRDSTGPPPPPRAFSPVSPTNTSPVNYSPQPNSVRRKPTPTYANHQPQDSVSSVYSQQQPEVLMPKQQPHAPQPAAANPPPADEPWMQPPSRFSVTTYATSISTTATPRESLDDFHHNRDSQPPVPRIPQQHRPQSPKEEEPAQSIMNRSRPKLEGFNYNKKDQAPIVVSLKDQIISPYETVVERESPAARDHRAAAIGVANGSKPAPRRVSATPSDVNKSLPPAPPELEALSLYNGADGKSSPKSPKDLSASERVALYDAQIQALGNRRINITRSIKQMTELMPTDNILNSEAVRRKREVEKQKVEALKTELAEVQREMYELGLKLHRAYKRQEKEASFEPTTLWVRRVTG